MSWSYDNFKFKKAEVKFEYPSREKIDNFTAGGKIL